MVSCPYDCDPSCGGAGQKQSGPWAAMRMGSNPLQAYGHGMLAPTQPALVHSDSQWGCTAPCPIDRSGLPPASRHADCGTHRRTPPELA